MGGGRWFRENYEGRERPFDWYALAKQYQVPPAQAQDLYEQAMREVEHASSSHRNAEALYRELLEQAHPAGPTPTPGKVTRSMRLEAEWNQRTIAKRAPTAPGKRSLSSYIEPSKSGPRRAVQQPRSLLASNEPLAQLQDQLAQVRNQQSIAMGRFDEDRVDELDEQARALEARIAAASGEHAENSEAAPEVAKSLPGYDAVHEILADLARRQPGEANEPDKREPAAPLSAADALPGEVRARMERGFGIGFQDVSVHPDSAHASGPVRAFTRGNEVHFREGAFAPGTAEGDALIAHEFAHVAQNRQAGGQAGTRRAIEADADQAAAAVLAGQAARVHMQASVGASYAFSDDDDHEPAASVEPSESASEPAAATPESADAGADAQADEEYEEIDLQAEIAAISQPVAAEASDSEGGGAGGAGGAGGEAGAETAVPDLASAAPEAGLGQLQGVRPDKQQTALGGVRAAIGTDVGESRSELAQNPPQQMSDGDAAETAASGEQAASEASSDSAAATESAAASPEGNAAAGAETADTIAGTEAEPEAPADEAASQTREGEAEQANDAATQILDDIASTISSLFGSFFGGAAENAANQMAKAEADGLASSLDNLSTKSDVAADPGPAPELAVSTEAQATAKQDRAALEQQVDGAAQQTAAEVQRPMGEDSIATTVPSEQLRAAPIESAAASEIALPDVATAAGNEEIGIIAQEQHQSEIDAAMATAQAGIASERAQHSEAEAKARSDADQQMSELQQQTAADSEAARDAARSEVEQARGEWQAEVDAKTVAARAKADARVEKGLAEVEAKQTQANADAQKHIDEGQKNAENEKQKGEQQAQEAKDKGKEKSSGFFGWVASKAKKFFNGIKQAVSQAIAAAKAAVKKVIDAAKKLASKVIELARQAIVTVIQHVGKALIAIGDQLLAAFPGLREKFRSAIQSVVDQAVETVNKLAEGLKAAVQKALDLLGGALDGLLGLLEKGLHAVVDACAAVVNGAIEAAKAIADKLGPWLKLLKHVAGAPGAWLGKLGAAVIDGIQNHLWKAFKTAVTGWFQSKVMELLGVGGMLLQLLLDGGLTVENITQMAMDALVSAIPAALIAILVQKLVAMLVPAAGALMTIIEGLQAAWGVVSRIIAAFQAFMAFLLAVETGSAGPLFATALAAGAIVVLDFVATWLLKKLRGAASKVGSKLKGLAKKFKDRRKGKKPKQRGKDDTKNRDQAKTETMAEKQARLRRASADVRKLFRSKRRVRPLLRMSLGRIKRRHKLSALHAKRVGTGKTSKYEITAVINPKLTFEETAASDDAAALAKALGSYCQGTDDDSQTQAETQCGHLLKTMFPNSGYRVVWKHISGSEWSLTLHDAQGQSFTVGVLQKLRNDGQPVAKTGPKTDPKAPHNKKIAALIKEYRAKGWRLVGGGQSLKIKGGRAEQVIDTFGGHKDTRRIDITLENPTTLERLHINVGLGMMQRRLKEDGSGYHEIQSPIKREREAQEDVESVLKSNETYLFVPYNF
ncbi:eCIS core domain-containing protein [Haliangium ochraceum]|uniref:eCIS core domain-containing protein n=1 Tax=Haliangium ochraceum (strain DSM 14365 / JCM 11303 / SMP-2) TaxID=502025 RepID=D0LZQ0_HALO1|nr:DUF4157 domain-containing protein [Haliangium ochraceum]ACY18029.1 hypothetical protein Hoch_5546 [Haliangium ochraceum DSM 14365]